MKRSPLTLSLVTCLVLLLPAASHAATEAELLSILQSSNDAVARSSACQQLRTLGSPKSIPLLGGMLGVEGVSHAARYALEGMPYPEAGAMLRASLARISGTNQAGIIDSLGWRREPQAVPLLMPLIKSDDVLVATSAATALGRIGGTEATAVLMGVSTEAPQAVQHAAYESLLRCAEKNLREKTPASALEIYKQLAGRPAPEPMRVAAWRGWMLTSTPLSSEMTRLMVTTLSDTSHFRHQIAVKVLREIYDPALLMTCRNAWETLPADAQLALLDAMLLAGLNVEDAIQQATQSPHEAVRIAGWESLALHPDSSRLQPLAAAAAAGEPAEREVARRILTVVRGPNMTTRIADAIPDAPAPVQAALLRALGERGDPAAAPVLLNMARTGERPVRYAALASLQTLALPDTLESLLTITAQAKATGERDAALQAVFAVCRADGDKERITSAVLQALTVGEDAERLRLLPILPELGTPGALAAATAATTYPDPEIAKESLRVLARWPNSTPAPDLLALARTTDDPTTHALALRGAIAVAALDTNPQQRLAWLTQALETAKRTEEKKQALGAIGQQPTAAALEIVIRTLQEPELANEAALAALAIAETLAPTESQLANDVAVEVLQHADAPEVFRRAWKLRIRPQTGGPRLRHWQLNGPHRQDGVTGAQAVFNLEFGPEKDPATTQWQRLPEGEQVNLAARFPGQDNCIAYLRTQVKAPEAMPAAILLGSDDGAKIWVNGTVVHSNNIDRGEVPDDDVAPIQLQKGLNEIIVKVSQGGGGWSMSARIVNTDGTPVNGLTEVAP
ncbi:MAG: hypothetical protein RI897_31 [Verrucomicrobiota bacterium]|jgi:HEAT repeat protein